MEGRDDTWSWTTLSLSYPYHACSTDTQLHKLCAFVFGEMYDALSCSTRHSALQWISITTSINIREGISLNINKATKLFFSLNNRDVRQELPVIVQVGTKEG